LPVLLVEDCEPCSELVAGTAAVEPPCAFGSVVLEPEPAELSRGTVLEGAVVVLLPLVLEGLVLEGDEDGFIAPGVVAFWSGVLLDGAAVGFAWLGVWSVAPGVVDV